MKKIEPRFTLVSKIHTIVNKSKMNKTIEHIVARLRDASHAYYETGTSLMTDDEYDDLLEQLRALAPSHPYFEVVGAPVTDGAVRLPIPMPSLRKVKPDSVGSWASAYAGPWIASDKLDGISALWVPSRKGLYLRGDGLVGQDVTHIVPYIQGLASGASSAADPSLMIRGELITPKGVITDTIARSWVNGQLHQKTPNPADLAKIQFVAYSVYSSKPVSRAKQMEWLKREKFITVPHALIKTTAELGPRLIQQRENGPYEIDGLVLGQAAAIPEGLDAKAALPRDAVAFKMPLADQKARASVVAVHWASSMGGLWIPRIEIKPVTIGSATITYATGHNAKFIKDNGIGPGAVIVLRRSGDVIPTVEAVVSGAPGGAALPDEGTWAWDERGTHAVDTRGVVTTEKHALFMVDSLNVFDIDGVSTKNAAKLVEGGFNDLAALWGATEASLVGVVGTALGAKLFQQLHNKLPVASPEQWIAAYQGWPRGFGKSRIAALLECGPVEAWPTLKTPPKGIGRETFDSIIECVDGWVAWRGGFKWVNVSAGASASASASAVGKRVKPTSIVQENGSTKPASVPAQAPTKPIQKKGAFVMTGFRDKELEARLAAAGWVTHDTVKSDTTVLIVADESKMGSSKVAAAEKKGVRIILRKDVDQLL